MKKHVMEDYSMQKNSEVNIVQNNSARPNGCRGHQSEYIGMHEDIGKARQRAASLIMNG